MSSFYKQFIGTNDIFPLYINDVHAERTFTLSNNTLRFCVLNVFSAFFSYILYHFIPIRSTHRLIVWSSNAYAQLPMLSLTCQHGSMGNSISNGSIVK